MSFRHALSRSRRRWRDAGLVVKGLRVVALPVLALAVSSALFVQADSQRMRAYDQREAAESVNAGVADVRSLSLQAQRAVSDAVAKGDKDLLGAVGQYRAQWDRALARVEAAALANPGARLNDEVAEVRAASNELVAATTELLSIPLGTQPSSEVVERATVANERFEAAMGNVAAAAEQQAARAAAAYEADNRRTTRIIIVSAVLGSLAAIAAMVTFAVAIRRRVQALEANARALGEGRPLIPLAGRDDELGRLSRDIDRAAALLGERERDLHGVAETLRGSEQRVSLALMAGAMGTWDVDLATNVSIWDEQCAAVHGTTLADFPETYDAWFAMVHPDDRDAVLAAGAEAIPAGGRWTAEYRTITADGSVRWVETYGQSVLDGDGKPVRLVGVASDISRRKAAELRLRDAIVEAETASRTKNDFLSRVSHELRTPLNAIIGFSQLLEMDNLTESQDESVAQVLASGRHLLGLIEDVLDISRIEAGNLAVSIEAVDVAEVVDETVALVSSLATGLGVAVDVVRDDWSAAHIKADRRRLKQVLVNLASNGIKYNRPGGRLTFRCSSPTAGLLRIAVSDTGHGIAADRLDRLFTPFDRLGAETTAVDGTGIGLALSQRLAEMMGSTLRVDTEIGAGSTFSIDLPLADDPVEAAELAQIATPVLDHGPTGTVLYVEDNPSNLKLVQRVLDRRGGVHLLSAGTGAIALSLAARVPLDLVLLDLHLPDMPGAEVLRRLRELPGLAGTRIVVVSADATPGQVERLRDAGADAFLTKPLDVPAFLRTVDAFLDGATV